MAFNCKDKKPPLVKVEFPLDANQWHGHEAELVWAEKVSSNRCRIRNSPFFAKGVSFDDIVFVENNEGSLIFRALSMAGGHSTYRVLLKKDVSKDEFCRFWSPLEALGCSYESADGETMTLLTVDVPPCANIYKVYDLLEEGERAKVWGFEEGNCGHSV